MRLVQLSIFVAIVACANEEQVHLERSELIDTGALCVRSEPTGEVSVRVLVDGCASGCARVSESACELEVGDGEIVVHSSIEVEEERGPVSFCPAACVPIGASCAPIAISPGYYKVLHGEASTNVRLPTELQLLLGGESSAADLGCY